MKEKNFLDVHDVSDFTSVAQMEASPLIDNLTLFSPISKSVKKSFKLINITPSIFSVGSLQHSFDILYIKQFINKTDKT